jgi:hypothetical protein
MNDIPWGTVHCDDEVLEWIDELSNKDFGRVWFYLDLLTQEGLGSIWFDINLGKKLSANAV